MQRRTVAIEHALDADLLKEAVDVLCCGWVRVSARDEATGGGERTVVAKQALVVLEHLDEAMAG